MPWNVDSLGNRSYKLSIFAKEELPTWGEMYEVWKSKNFFYAPNIKSQQVLDIYWKIPRQKYLIATVCNQLNKMIFEDKFDYQPLFTDMYYEGEICEITDMRFVFIRPPKEGSPSKVLEAWANKFFCGTSSQPPIITIPLPAGDISPFITNKYSRINIFNLDHIEIIPVIMFDTDSHKNIMAAITSDFIGDELFMYNKIIDFFMKPYVEYFQEPVGWKDVESKPVSIIGSDITDHCK